jgi:hypothetical protein
VANGPQRGRGSRQARYGTFFMQPSRAKQTASWAGRRTRPGRCSRPCPRSCRPADGPAPRGDQADAHDANPSKSPRTPAPGGVVLPVVPGGMLPLCRVTPGQGSVRLFWIPPYLSEPSPMLTPWRAIAAIPPGKQPLRRRRAFHRRAFGERLLRQPMLRRPNAPLRRAHKDQETAQFTLRF